MMATTGGINTHRGAIWALGLLVAAAAIDTDNVSAEQTAALDGIRATLERFRVHMDSWVNEREFHDSDAILPPSDSSLAEMRELISGDGLIAG